MCFFFFSNFLPLIFFAVLFLLIRIFCLSKPLGRNRSWDCHYTNSRSYLLLTVVLGTSLIQINTSSCYPHAPSNHGWSFWKYRVQSSNTNTNPCVLWEPPSTKKFQSFFFSAIISSKLFYFFKDTVAKKKICFGLYPTVSLCFAK